MEATNLTKTVLTEREREREIIRVYDKKELSRDNLLFVATHYGIERPWIDSRFGARFSPPSRTVLGPTQPLVGLVSDLFPRGKAVEA